jgi:DAK2 domain fusion protein YloV
MAPVPGAESGAAPLSIVRPPLLDVGGTELLAGIGSALAWLQANQEQANDLNVFPVPDGDTGSNMCLTLQSAVEEAQRAAEPASAASVMAAVAHGSLMGARGNSGVILSQVFRGFAQGLDGHRRADAALVCAALSEASRVADKAVMKPTEGTILTVVRDASAAAVMALGETTDLRQVLMRAVVEAHAAVERTTDQLPVLKEAGVVDAGGFGFAVILEGFAAALADRDLEDGRLVAPGPRSGASRVLVPGEPPAASRAGGAGRRRGAAAVAERPGGWGHCTEFLVEGPGLDPDALRALLAPRGESALIVGDSDLVRVHIHTFDPTGLIAAASQYGRLAKLKVDDMSAQHHEVVHGSSSGVQVDAPAARRPLAVVSVAPGSGFHDILRSLGAERVVEGGQTMNPSTEDLLNAVAAANADRVILLPNNGNVILTAEQVDALAEGVDVCVVATRNLPQGISALLSYDAAAPMEDNVARMREAAGQVRSVEITRAVRDSTANGHAIKAGDVLALIDDEITHVGSDDGEVVEGVLRSLAETPEIVTIYRGSGVSDTTARRLVRALEKAHPAIDFELQNGGQEHYPYVLSLE